MCFTRSRRNRRRESPRLSTRLTWSAADWQTLSSITGKGRTDMAKKRTKIEVEESTGNVFADLGLPNPEQELLKAGLTLEIYRILKARRRSPTPGARERPCSTWFRKARREGRARLHGRCRAAAAHRAVEG